jgi:hypothetical protein
MLYPDEHWEYYVCAKEFGWTPDEVDNQPVQKVAWVLAINNIVVEVENARNK